SVTYLKVALERLQKLRRDAHADQAEAARLDAARQAAAAQLQPMAPRRQTLGVLQTRLGTFGIPLGWETMEASNLKLWTELTDTPVIGGMTNRQRSPTSIIDVTPLAPWTE